MEAIQVRGKLKVWQFLAEALASSVIAAAVLVTFERAFSWSWEVNPDTPWHILSPITTGESQMIIDLRREKSGIASMVHIGRDSYVVMPTYIGCSPEGHLFDYEGDLECWSNGGTRGHIRVIPSRKNGVYAVDIDLNGHHTFVEAAENQ